MKKIALVSGLVGAVLLAANVNLNMLAFMLMLGQSAYWVKVMWGTEREVALLNLGFIVINVIGIVRALG